MLELARVSASDTVYDLGCGDGRIVILAARRFGARGIGIDIDPARIEEANRNARDAGGAGKVQLVLGDVFYADQHDATGDGIGDACHPPSAPQSLAVDDETTMPQIAQLQLDLAVMALACDIACTISSGERP